MMRLLGEFFTKIARQYLPDAFIFALVLTIVTFILGMVVERASFIEMVTYFGRGFWDFLSFSMQMVLILVTGSALATSRPVYRGLRFLAKRVQKPVQAIVVSTLVMMAGCWLNWGFGLIVSALMAKELAKSVKGVHYPLLVASAYSGFVIWHAGFSGSIPLKIAGNDEIMQQFGDGAVIPGSETIFSVENLLLIVVLLVTIPVINALMHPRNKEDIIGVDPGIFKEDEQDNVVKERSEMTFAEKAENSWILSMIFGGLCFVYSVYYFSSNGGISLNSVNFIFLSLGIVLHSTPIRYVRAINEGVKTCGGIVLQFPLYAGIMKMMIGSGLAVTLSNLFVSISSGATLPFFTYISAGILNFFVPSGGGQWAVQGPVMIPAAKALDVSYGTTAMAISWGDGWTNLVQPFWALPLLAVAQLKMRDIMGYTIVIFLFTGLVTSLFMLFVF